MKVRAVLDLMDGVVVRGVGGKRDQYRPIESKLTRSTAPRDIACAIHEATGISDFYIADLDAIEHRTRPDWALASWFAAQGWSLWIDCGLVSAAEVAAWPSETARPVIGTETFEDGPNALNRMQAAWAVLSLDMVNGVLLGSGSRRFADPVSLWESWRATGVADLILMDLARVGSYLGPIETSSGKVEAASPLYLGAKRHAAGGVRHAQDLKVLEAAGYHSALVASAIHDGRLSQASETIHRD